MTPQPTPRALLGHLKAIPMTEWVWADAEKIFAALEAGADLYEALAEWLTVGNDMKARRAVREKARAALRKADGS